MDLRPGTSSFALLVLGACVSSVEAPPLSEQATVAYGERLYLVDQTRNAARGNSGCTALRPLGAMPAATSSSTPFNCFVKLRSLGTAGRRLKVDRVETTNALYQLCVDSGACAEPDPSDSDKGEVCQNEDRFDACPVVDVDQQQASTFCRWVGRRLPTSFELLVVRQAGATDPQDPGTITPFVTGELPPSDCYDAILATPDCAAARPRPVISESHAVAGAAPDDAVTGSNGTTIFDLTGNLSEWTADRFPPSPESTDRLPWFCTGPLPDSGTPGPPRCPDGASCVFGTYDPAGDARGPGEHPVCVTETSGRFTGSIGALLGGSWADAADGTPPDTLVEEVGVFGRRIEIQPEGFEDGGPGRQYGFRCVGDRESGTDPFDDLFELVTE